MQERRKANRQVTVEQVKKELDDVVNFDGGLVYKCDLEKFSEKNDAKHDQIIEANIKSAEAIKKQVANLSKKMDRIYPELDNKMKLAEAFTFIATYFTSKDSRGLGWWLRIIITIVFLLGALFSAIMWVKSIAIKVI